MAEPVCPIEFPSSTAGDGPTDLLPGHGVDVPTAVVERLRAACTTVVTRHEDPAGVAEASRDWWPLAMHWALRGQVLRTASVVCRPASTAEVAAVVAVCHDAHVPVTTAGGRSGVCGASVPVFGGVVLDTTAFQGVVAVDDRSLTVTVLPGTFGHELEATLRDRHGLTVGHWPQSIELSTVGGWVACRGAGQYSNRYGKIEDIVQGLEVVLADGRVLDLDAGPSASSGPDLRHLLMGSEGTLGVITRVSLRARPAPAHEQRSAWSFASWEDGLDACRRALRLGSSAAVLRLYDAVEAQRSHGGDGGRSVLLVLDEGHEPLVRAAMAVVDEACAATPGARPHDPAFVDRWVHHRNDTSALQALTRKGFVVDTLEITAPWSRLTGLRDAVCDALLAVPHARAASCHLSHSYDTGACLYFTFAATPPEDLVESTYTALWDAAKRVLVEHGAAISHHHGIGLNQARYVRAHLGDEVLGALAAVKRALDPHGILNPGKLGLPTPFGTVPWPAGRVAAPDAGGH